MRIWSLLLLVSAAVTGPAAAQSVVQPKQAVIASAAHGAIRDWHADNDEGIYLRDRTNRWYYAKFTHRCPGVLYDQLVTFKTFGDTRFDRSSRVVTQMGSCALDSLVESPAPAAKGGKAPHPRH